MQAAGFIKPIQHSHWLSNIVQVKKKNGQIRCCVDFRNLNRVCPKDEFPLPKMDLLIDSAAGSAMFSFMDEFSGYNHIRMALKDAETCYPRAERACLAIVYASQRLRHYFQAYEVWLMTKSHEIKALLRQPILFGRISQWLLQLSQFPGDLL